MQNWHRNLRSLQRFFYEHRTFPYFTKMETPVEDKRGIFNTFHKRGNTVIATCLFTMTF